MWHSHKYFIITGTYTFYTSSLYICPYDCAATQRRNIDINDPTHVHPRYLVGLHPLWPITIADLASSEYKNDPWLHHLHIAPATVDGYVFAYKILQNKMKFYEPTFNFLQLEQYVRIATVSMHSGGEK